MEEIEVWKDILSFENYEVSTSGYVRNKKTKRILKAANNGGSSSIYGALSSLVKPITSSNPHSSS